MLINLKIHSSYHKYFGDTQYTFDAVNGDSVNEYLKAMHPLFAKYINQIENDESDEYYSLLDEDLNIIGNDALGIKRFKEGEVVHLVPAIFGGGGKRGGLLAMVAIAGFAFATGGFGAAAAQSAAAGGGTAASLGMGGATGNLAASGALGSTGAAGAGGGVLNAFAAMPSFAKSMIGNLAMSFLSSLFTKKPKTNDTDTSTRTNGMFGSLKNTTESGTPIPLIYGEFRVAGQMLSGYIESEDHGKSEIIKVGDKF